MSKNLLFFTMLCLSLRYSPLIRAVRATAGVGSIGIGVGSSSSSSSISSSRFNSAGRMRSVAVDNPGPSAALRVTDEAIKPTITNNNDIIMRVAYCGVNRLDVLQKLGRYPVPSGESEILGLEVSGVVDSVGEGVDSLRPGDRVAALLGGGGYAEYARVNAGHAMKLPDCVSLRSAACLPEAWLTAFQLLFFVGDFKANDTVLVHASASGVGTAAIQLATSFNGRAYGTAGSDEKCQLVKSLGAVDCFNYRQVDFADSVLSATGGRGVDLILDCVGGSHANSNLRCLATDAKWILYGLLGGASVSDERFLGKLLQKRASLRASLLRSRSQEYKSRLVSEFSKRALPLFSSGQLKPVIHSQFSLESVELAHKLMESNSNAGKILLAIDESLDKIDGGGGGKGEL